MIVYGLMSSLYVTRVTYASLKEYVIRGIVQKPNDILFSVDGQSNWLPQHSGAHNKTRVLPVIKLNTIERYAHAMKHVLYGLEYMQNLGAGARVEQGVGKVLFRG